MIIPENARKLMESKKILPLRPATNNVSLMLHRCFSIGG